jgi:hypothetical protein
MSGRAPAGPAPSQSVHTCLSSCTGPPCRGAARSPNPRACRSAPRVQGLSGALLAAGRRACCQPSGGAAAALAAAPSAAAARIGAVPPLVAAPAHENKHSCPSLAAYPAPPRNQERTQNLGTRHSRPPPRGCRAAAPQPPPERARASGPRSCVLSCQRPPLHAYTLTRARCRARAAFQNRPLTGDAAAPAAACKPPPPPQAAPPAAVQPGGWLWAAVLEANPCATPGHL